MSDDLATTALDAEVPEQLSGIDVPALRSVMEEIRREPAKAMVEFRLRSRWQGQTRSETVVGGYRIGGREIARRFALSVDEPLKLLGQNTAPNPQEYLMTGAERVRHGGLRGRGRGPADVHAGGPELKGMERDGPLAWRLLLGLAGATTGPPRFHDARWENRKSIAMRDQKSGVSHRKPCSRSLVHQYLLGLRSGGDTTDGPEAEWTGVASTRCLTSTPGTGLHGRPTFCYRSDMAKRRLQGAPHPRPSEGFDTVLRFTVTLEETEPPIWRRIEIPATYDFWGLHVAIQDAMGWLDSHLHEFEVTDPSTGDVVRVGIPNDELPDEHPTVPGWTLSVARYFREPGVTARYVYDFGDDWIHRVTFEGLSPRAPGTEYPRCVSGARRCPPEDCGGIGGFEEFLAAIADPQHDEHEAMLTWAGGAYDPDDFDPATVRFDDPAKRLRMAKE